MTFPSHTSAPDVSSLDADSVTSPPVTRLSIKTTVEASATTRSETVSATRDDAQPPGAVRDVARVCGNERDEQENFDRRH